MCKAKIDIELSKRIRCTSRSELASAIQERKKAFFILLASNLLAGALEGFGIEVSSELKVLS
jgi:hypothetical protein